MAAYTPPRRDDYWENRLRRRSPGTVTRIDDRQGTNLVTRSNRGDYVNREGTEGSDPVMLATEQLSRDNGVVPTLPTYESGRVVPAKPFRPLSGETARTPYGTISSRPENTEERIVREWSQEINGTPPTPTGTATYPDPKTGKPVAMASTLAAPRTINGRPATDYQYREESVPPPAPEPRDIPMTPQEAKIAEAGQRQQLLSRAFQNPDSEEAAQSDEYQAWRANENATREASGLGPLETAYNDFRRDQDVAANTEEAKRGILRQFRADSRAARTEESEIRGRGPRVGTAVRRSPEMMKELDRRAYEIAKRKLDPNTAQDLLVSDAQDMQNAAKAGGFVPKTPEQVGQGINIRRGREEEADRAKARSATESLGEALAKARTPLEIDEAIQKYGAAGATTEGAAMLKRATAETEKEDADGFQHARDLRAQGIDPKKATERGKFMTRFNNEIKTLQEVGGYNQQYLIDNGVFDKDGRMDAAKLGPLVEKQKTITSMIGSLQKRLASTNLPPEEETRIMGRIEELQANRFASPKQAKPESNPDVVRANKEKLKANEGREFIGANGIRYRVTNGVPVPVR